MSILLLTYHSWSPRTTCPTCSIAMNFLLNKIHNSTKCPIRLKLFIFMVCRYIISHISERIKTLLDTDFLVCIYRVVVYLLVYTHK